MTYPRPRGTVLLVEDDPDYAGLLRDAFADAGFQTLEAVNGEKALQLLRDQRVDLVISDFMMPELNGLELCRLLSEHMQTANLKMILYSCNTDPTFRRKARELGALEYLPKSENAEEFVEQICRLAGWIEKQEAAAEAGRPGLEESVRLAATHTEQLDSLLARLLDFLRIAALSGELPDPTRMALEAAERTGGDLRRTLAELEKVLHSPAPEAEAETQPILRER
jgi:DNA-binding response OmpR family regulator